MAPFPKVTNDIGWQKEAWWLKESFLLSVVQVPHQGRCEQARPGAKVLGGLRE